MTLIEALAHGEAILARSATPRLDARLLLQHLLGMNHATLILQGERPLPPPELRRYQSLLERAVQGEPLPYIIGHAPFYDFDLQVTPAVLIPRPETEELVAKVLRWARSAPPRPLRIADAGTGSGCIPITLARQLPKAILFAGDISAAALAVAARNAAALAPDRIRFFQGDLLAPLSSAPAAQLDAVTANLPYITDDEWTHLDDGVKYYEPSLALRGGGDGLTYIRRLLQQATIRCKPHGRLFLEIGWQQGAAVLQLVAEMLPAADVRLHQDLAGRDRIVEIGLAG